MPQSVILHTLVPNKVRNPTYSAHMIFSKWQSVRWHLVWVEKCQVALGIGRKLLVKRKSVRGQLNVSGGTWYRWKCV